MKRFRSSLRGKVMRKMLRLSLVIAVLTALLTPYLTVNAPCRETVEVEAVPGEFIVGINWVDEELLKDFEVVRTIRQINALLVKAKDSVEVQAFIETLTSNPSVRYVEPNYIVHLPPIEVIQVIEANRTEDAHVPAVTSTPNDPWWSTDPLFGIGQWNMRVVDADRAWDVHAGSHDVVVAVVDTGVRGTHYDLDANYIPGGYDWVNDDGDPNDDNGHGTHVAGIIAAETNNGYGVAGLAQVSIMAEKVLNNMGLGTVANLVLGILHAADSGADVINLSLGTYTYSTALEEAATYAYNRGCILVAAAGNEGTDRPMYPAAFDCVVAVASTYGEPNDVRAPYSNYGIWVTLSAPGGYEGYYVLSTYFKGDDYFAYMYGTSQSTPHVSGLAALYKSLNPTATNAEVEFALKRGVEDKGETGWDRLYGYGRINAYRTLTLPKIKSVGGEGELTPLDKHTLEDPWTGLTLIASLAALTPWALRKLNLKLVSLCTGRAS